MGRVTDDGGSIAYEGRQYQRRPGETVLDALIRQGANPQFSCRSGACLVCIQRCTGGTPTEASQRGVRATLRRAGYFLPCTCVPSGDISLSSPRHADLFSKAVVAGKEQLAPDVYKILLQPATDLYYHAGQFINLRRPDGLTRSYSLASLPSEDAYLELHVKRLEGGEMSAWLCDTVEVDEALEIQGPNGRCYYALGSQDEDLILIGNGTGVAPLLGVIRDALNSGHAGQLSLYHGSRHRPGLYLHHEFTVLSEQWANFHYVPCLSGEDVGAPFVHGRAHDVARERHLEIAGKHIFVAGLRAMVDAVEVWAKAHDVPSAQLHLDPYDVKTLDAPGFTVDEPDEVVVPQAGNRRRPDPDPEMWEALHEGKLLRTILTDFYAEVFSDPALAPYFRSSRQDHLIGQVYSFMRDIFTGQRLYFGMQPRPAHHWMVISAEVFDHRERLMTACLERHGLAPHLVQRWRRLEEQYRHDVVKAKPWKLEIDGVQMPLDGYGDEVMTIGTVCDGCGGAIEAGERARYHLRLGLTYCTRCTDVGNGRPKSLRPTSGE